MTRALPHPDRGMDRHEIPSFREGERVEFVDSYERGGHVVPIGATAVVEYVDGSLLTVRLDEPDAAVEEVSFGPDEFKLAHRILRVLTRARAPAK